MTPAELAPLLTTFGPMGVVIWWVLRTQAESKAQAEAKKADQPDPVMLKLESMQRDYNQQGISIHQAISGVDKRLAIVETKIEERNK